MYLPTDSVPPIFVDVLKKLIPLKFPSGHIRTVIGSLCLLLAWAPAFGQQVWPGDVTNNGIVDHQDMLFWAYARGKTGGERAEVSTDFTPEAVDTTTWADVFPGSGHSVAFADCNGDGIVDDQDSVVISDNYYLALEGEPDDDVFAATDGPIASNLYLGGNLIEAPAGEETTFPLVIATADTQDIEVAYLSFQINYGPGLIAEAPSGDLLIQLLFEDADNDWLLEGNDVEIFVHHHENLGFSDVVLYMDSLGTFGVGHGEVAEFSIVVEEIIFGLHDVNIDRPVILNGDFRKVGYVGSQGVTLNLVGKPVDAGETALSDDAISVFPNPSANGVIQAQLLDRGAHQIERMELFDQSGKIVSASQPRHRYGWLNVSHLPTGVYSLKVTTDAGVKAMQVQVSRN